MVDIVRPVYGEAWASVGEKVSPALTKIQGGWIQEMMPYQWENFLQNRQDTALLYMLQKGVPEWDASQEYIAGKSVVTYQTNLYISVLDSTNVLPTVQASWKKLNPSTSSSGIVTIAGGGTGASTATEARTNLGIGTSATADFPVANGLVVKLSDNTLVARTIAGTAGYITVTNGDGVSGNLTINVGANVAKTDADASWTTTSSIRLPAGSTAQRGVGAPGRIRFNLESGVYEGYDNTGWNPIGSTGTLDVQNFSGDGVKTSFTMSTTPRAENNTQVYFNGVYQQKNSYNLVGSNLVFDEAPALGIEIEVVTVSSVAIGTTTAGQTSIVDSGNYFSSESVEGALQEVGLKASFVKDAILSYPDYAAASAAAATLPDGQLVVSEADEIRGVVDGGVIAQEQSIYKVADYAKIRSYTGRGTRLRVTDPTGVHWWVRRGTAADNGGTILRDALDRSWEREYSGDVNVQWFGAALDGIQDDAPALRLARDAMLSAGGGVIALPHGTLRVASYETRDVLVITSGGGQQVVPTSAALFVDPGISLRGAGSSHTKIKNSGGVINSIVILLDYKDGFVSGFDIEGAGDSNNAYHGLSTASSTSFDHVLENVAISDVSIHHVGSYGVGNQMQCRNVTVTDVRTWNTGADGVDWKVRGESSIAGLISEGVVFTRINIREYGKRAGAGSPTGIGIRGRAIVDGIEVYGATSDKPGIDFVAGVASTEQQDYRPSASNSSISNWYVEGVDPKSDNVGLLIYASSAVNVGVGVAKWCKVKTEGAAVTPYDFDDSGSMTSVTVIPAHGRTGFEFTAGGSTGVGCRVISDKAYFDAKRNNLQAGQTVFLLPWDSSIANSVERQVIKNGVKLNAGADYALVGSTLTLVTPVSASDSIMVVMPPLRGFRVQADYCNLVACRQDRHVPNSASFATQLNYDTGVISGFMWDGHRGVSEVNSPTVAGLQSQDPTVADKDFRILAKGVGTVILGGSANKVGFYSGAGVSKQSVSGSRGGNEALNSLLTALNSAGLISNNSTA